MGSGAHSHLERCRTFSTNPQFLIFNGLFLANRTTVPPFNLHYLLATEAVGGSVSISAVNYLAAVAWKVVTSATRNNGLTVLFGLVISTAHSLGAHKQSKPGVLGAT